MLTYLVLKWSKILIIWTELKKKLLQYFYFQKSLKLGDKDTYFSSFVSEKGKCQHIISCLKAYLEYLHIFL